MNFKNLFNLNIFYSFISVFVLLYLCYHLFYGKYNIGNYLINDFKEELLINEYNNLTSEISSIDKDLNALYTNKDDFIDEIKKKKYGNTSSGEVLIKIN
ncbi:septum formation initiator family protein [Alphaproteobacteria bacterium]|jgi:cell division protein FtsB|nr:septum formation initiator family protein [Alphaproteobacteria bacterium]